MESHSKIKQCKQSLLLAQMVKNLLASVGDQSLIPGWGRFPGEGNGKPLQYSCLKDPMDRQWVCKESDSTERLSLSLPSLGQVGLAFGGSAS